MRELRFALGYMPHRKWGNILQAQFLEREQGKEFYHPLEFIQNDPATKAYQRLTPMQREVVELVDSYSDRNLHRKFARKGTPMDFLEVVDDRHIQTQIRPYIESYLYRILEIARENRISVFVKDKSNRNVFPEDFIRIERKAADPVFEFHYQGRLTYSLDLYLGGETLKLKDRTVEIISNTPCCMILDSALIFVNEIDGKKLGPFLVKEQVVVPVEMEQKYFSTFVRNSIRDFHTVTDGFTVQEKQPVRKAELVLEHGMNHRPVWYLYFWYNRQRILIDSPVKRFVNYTGSGNDHKFEWYRRDPEWEQLQVEQCNEMGLRSRDQKSFYLYDDLNDTIEGSLFRAISFTNEIAGDLEQAQIGIRHRLQKKYFLGTIGLEISSEEQEDWFDLSIRVSFGTFSVRFVDLKHHILEGIREYELPDGEIAILPEEWFARYRSVFEFGKIREGHFLIHKQHFSMVDGPIRVFHAETLDRLEKLNEVKLLPDFPLPEGLRAQLRLYQLEGYKWLSFLEQNGFGGCLADDMGLGKTLQAITILLRVREDHSGQKTSLVILPASLLHNWSGECQRFAPGLRVFPYIGIHRKLDSENIEFSDVVLSTYHTVRQDIERLSKIQFHYVILDESQMIKNPGSKLYQSILELRADHRMVLTGTPIENSLTDLWSQINFVNPGLLGTLSFFKRSFVQPIEKRRDGEREEKLRELIHPFILRRTKEAVARELPPVDQQVRYCSMTDGQRRVYEEEKSLARNSILENLEEIGLERSALMVLRALTRLRQIANHPALLEEFRGIDSGKFSEVYRDLESVVSEGHKVLVFSSFVRHLELFREQLNDQGIKYSHLTGSHSLVQRKQAVKDFQNTRGSSLFLISLKAGGVGLNLTEADYVFILDPWWNPAAEMQALNRAHRIGQEKNIFVYRFITSGTIEEKIQRLQQRKIELSGNLITSSNPLREITEKELLGLFS